MMGMPRRVPSAACWYASTMSYQACGVFGSGYPPPPLRIEPSMCAADWGASIEFFSIWVICPIFSSRVIWASNAATRSSTDLVASSQGWSLDGDLGDVGDAGDIGAVGDGGGEDASGCDAPGVTVGMELPQAATRTTA